MKFVAKPTTYNGVRFRSRLEARWAAFFDLCEWGWEYEPVDGETWTPDFAVNGAYGRIWVEVKPITWPADFDAAIRVVENAPELEKVRAANTDGERLVLGIGPHKEDLFGIILGGGWGFDVDAAVLHTGYACPLDFRAYYGSFGFRIGGEHNGDHHLHHHGIINDMPERLWREAGNLTQWRGDQAQP